MALLQSMWARSILVFIASPLSLSLPLEDILIVSVLEQRAKHS